MQPYNVYSRSLVLLFSVHVHRPTSYRDVPAPAFSVVLPNKGLEEAQRMLKYLDASKYIDQGTKAVFVDLSVYNVSIQTVHADFNVEWCGGESIVAVTRRGRRKWWSFRGFVADLAHPTPSWCTFLTPHFLAWCQKLQQQNHINPCAGTNESIGHHSTHWSIDAGRWDAHIVRFKNGDDVAASIHERNHVYSQCIGFGGKWHVGVRCWSACLLYCEAY